MADMNLKPEEVAEKVPSLRMIFKENYAENIMKGAYDQRDLDRLEKDDAHARTFLRTLKTNGDVGKAAELIDVCFKFRKSIGIWDLSVDDFPSEIKDKNAIYFKGQDKKGHPILYVNVKENIATDEHMPLLKQYIAFVVEKHHAKYPEQMCVVLMDMGSTDASNMGTDVMKYLVACFTSYFPVFMAYMISYNLPSLFNDARSELGMFLNDDQQQKLLLVKKNEISNFIADEYLWPHMK